MATASLSGHSQVRDGYSGGTGLLVPTYPPVGTTAVLTPTGTSSNAAIPAQAAVGASGVYRFATDTALHMKLGTSGSVTATTADPFFNAGFDGFIIINDATITHIAVIAA